MAINENIPITYEARDVVKIQCNQKDVLCTITRCNSKSNLFVTVSFGFVICVCVPHKLIQILSVMQISHLVVGGKCIDEMPISLNKVNHPWCSCIDSGVLSCL